MKRIWIQSLLIGSLALGGASAAFAQSRSSAKASASSKSKKTTSSSTSANGRASATATAGPADGAPDTTPAPFENAPNKLKGTAPAGWIPFNISGGSGSDGLILGWTLPPATKSKVKSSTPPKAEQKRSSDSVRIEVSPLIDPSATLESAVELVTAGVKADDPEAKFKPVEKTKIGGVDGAIVNATLVAELGGKAKRVYRRAVFVRDGKRFQISLESHSDTVAQRLPAFATFAKSIEFTAAPIETAALLKQYDNATHNVKYAIPAGWDTVQASCHGSIASFVLPMDELIMASMKADGESHSIVADMLFVAVNPVNDPKGSFDSAIEGKKASLKADMKAMEFKPVEKTKLPSGEAAILTGTMPGRDGEPEKVYRYILTVRDGKIYEVILYSHANTIARQTGMQEKIASSLAFASAAPKTDPASANQPTAAQPQQPSAADGF